MQVIMCYFVSDIYICQKVNEGTGGIQTDKSIIGEFYWPESNMRQNGRSKQQ